MSNDAWAAEVKRICPEAARILTAAGLPGVVEDENGAIEPGFRIYVLAGSDDSALLEISHGLPGENPYTRGDLSIEKLRVMQLIEVATYRGVFLATGWEVELKHGDTGPYILTKPKETQ
jgi:hypothetical protein